jgi:hypothetical protein
MNCKWAELMQWFENPVVAHCFKRKDRQVAATRRLCKEYTERGTEPVITHYDSYEESE